MCPLREKETVLGPASLEKRGDRRKAPLRAFISLLPSRLQIAGDRTLIAGDNDGDLRVDAPNGTP
jgi:hypothetical protein